jgi:hypothetical protein
MKVATAIDTKVAAAGAGTPKFLSHAAQSSN